MIAVITASTVLLGIAVCLLAVLMRSDGGIREHLERGNSLALLAERFRRDAHSAVLAPKKTANAGDVWRFPLVADPARVTWNTRPTANIFPARNMGRASPIRRETFALPKGCTARIETEAAGGGRLVRMVIAPPGAAPGGREICIEAVLGRDQRFAHRAEGGK